MNQFQSDTYKLFSSKIKAANGKRSVLSSLETGITWSYDNGFLTEPELVRLDGMIMDRVAKIDIEEGLV